jgi:hypothetical protein
MSLRDFFATAGKALNEFLDPRSAFSPEADVRDILVKQGYRYEYISCPSAGIYGHMSGIHILTAPSGKQIQRYNPDAPEYQKLLQDYDAALATVAAKNAPTLGQH